MNETVRPSPSPSHAIAMFAIVIAAFALVAVVAWFAVRPAAPTGCTADGLQGPNGEVYGRDPDQGCRFVDQHGNVVPGG